MTGNRYWSVYGFALAWSTAGCGGADSGALGQLDFSARCGPTDLNCVVSGMNAPIAVGASFPLEINAHVSGSAVPLVSLESVNQDVLAVSGSNLLGKSEGVSALLVIAPDDHVLDFVHIWVAQATRLALHRLSPDQNDQGETRRPMQLVVGEQLALNPVLYSGTQRLQGDFDASWIVDPVIFKLVDDGSASSRRLIARAPGKATVQAQHASLVAQQVIEVLQ